MMKQASELRTRIHRRITVKIVTKRQERFGMKRARLVLSIQHELF